jgi:hypothetical protein
LYSSSLSARRSQDGCSIGSETDGRQYPPGNKLMALVGEPRPYPPQFDGDDGSVIDW